MAKEKKKRGIGFKILRVVLIVLGVIVLAFAGLLAFMSAKEYKPADVEKLNAEGTASSSYEAGDQLVCMSWNIGYGALGDNADFFMDGGEMVKSADQTRVEENLNGILAGINMIEPDILLLQEIDRDSSRSYGIDELEFLRGKLAGYESSFANNFKTAFVPYPLPPIGKVDSGLATFTSAKSASIERIQLPVPFSWPVSTVNLKRCLMISHIPLEGTDKDLVLCNLHLEAYDSGEGKIAQTKMLAEILKEEAAKGNYVIAGGDFNQIFSNVDQDIYPAQEGEWAPGKIDTDSIEGDWTFLMDEETPSCRSLSKPYADADKDKFQFYLIDGFIVSDNVGVDEFRNLDLDFENSDHNPVVLKFTLEE